VLDKILLGVFCRFFLFYRVKLKSRGRSITETFIRSWLPDTQSYDDSHFQHQRNDKRHCGTRDQKDYRSGKAWNLL